MNTDSSTGAEKPACGYKISGVAALRPEAIPAELKARPHWVAWQAVDKGDGKKPAKVPVNPSTGGNAMSNDAQTWGTFDGAVERATRDDLAGIGLMFTGDDLVGVDLDDVMDGGVWTNPLAEAIVAGLDTYTEVSPSGKGVKMWLLSSVGPSKCTGTVQHDGFFVGYETYNRGRWFAVTGHVLHQYGGGVAQERTQEYERILEMGAQPKVSPPRPAKNAESPSVPGAGAATDSRSDEEAMLRKALTFLDADSEPSWFRYLCCLKSWGGKVGDAAARGLCAEWSRRSPKWDEPAFDDRWARAALDGGLTVGTLFFDAAKAGYRHGDALGRDGREYHLERREPRWEDTDLRITGAPGDPDNAPEPVVELPNIGGWTRTTISGAADRLGELFSKDGGLYLKSGVVVAVANGRTADVNAPTLQSAIEKKARLVAARNTKDGIRIVPANATRGQAEAILSAEPFHSRLPPLAIVSKCPVLVPDGEGGLAVARCYDRGSGVLVVGGKAEDMPLEDAVALLLDSLSEFDFQTAADRSRAIAALVTPALVQGGLLGGRAPVDLSEADRSQSGKGYRAKLVAAVYNDTPHIVTQRKGGTGGIEESFSAALMNGESFISIENVRGRIDSQMIESALTEDRCDARVPYRRPQQVDMRRVCVLMTSNKAELTRDLSNRTSPVRIRKREGHQFRSYDGLDLLGHVRANQGRYLGAVFAVVREWQAAGRPSTGEARHDFRAWAGSLDWIVQNLFGAAPLCDGVEEAKERMASPQLNWLRDIALAVAKAGRCGDELKTWELVRLAHDAGIEVPGLDEGADLEDDATMNKANQAVGRRMGQLFGDRDALSVDGHEVARFSSPDGQGRTKRQYVFRQPAAGGHAGSQGLPGGQPRAGKTVPPMEGTPDARIGAAIGENAAPGAPETAHGQSSPYTRPYAPAMVSAMKPQCSPIPPMGYRLLPEGEKDVEGGSCCSGSQECEPMAGIGEDHGVPAPNRPSRILAGASPESTGDPIPMAQLPAARELPEKALDDTVLTEDRQAPVRPAAGSGPRPRWQRRTRPPYSGRATHGSAGMGG